MDILHISTQQATDGPAWPGTVSIKHAWVYICYVPGADLGGGGGFGGFSHPFPNLEWADLQCAHVQRQVYNWTTLNRALCFWCIFRAATDCYCRPVRACGDVPESSKC